MAAPTPTARTPPTGYLLREGYRTTITFANQPAVQLWEETVKPPDIDGGEPIDISTMFNNKYETHAYRKIIKRGTGTAMCGYDPDALSIIYGMLNNPDTITVTYPDGSTEASYGAMIKLEFPEQKRGEFPKVTITFDFGCWDATNNVEAAPVYTAAAGT